MSEITSIKPQKRKKRVNIFLDGKFGFGLDLENFLKLGLKKGQELTQKQVKKIVKKAEFQKVYEKLLAFATLRPRSEREVKDWLKRKKVHQSIHEDLFSKLKRLELLDDTKFARWWLEQRLTFKPKGKRALKFELVKKGVEREVIEEALDEVKIDEEKIAKDLIKKFSFRWERFKARERREKVGAFLARRGVSWEAISKALKEEVN